MPAPPLTIAVCVEPGPSRLEYKAAAMFMTFRRHAGALASASIRSYAPRPGLAVSPWMRELMDHFEVEYIDEPLNAEHAHYALANKPQAIAHAEATCDTPFVTFLDSDILVWHEPSRFLLEDGVDIALVPDTTKTTASSGPGDPYEDYWQELYALVGAQERPFVTTTLSRERIRGSWNSGVVPLRRSAGIGREWRDALLTLLRRDFAPQQADYLRENNVLSAVAAVHYHRYRELPLSYNYPVQAFDRLGGREAAEDAVLWHYQPFFDRAFARFALRLEGARTLASRIAATTDLVEDLRTNYARRIGMDESFFQRARRRLRLGPRLRALLRRPLTTDENFD